MLKWKYHALMTEALLVKAALKIEKVKFLIILCIPSKHWGWSAIALGIGCLHSDRKYIGISPLQRKVLTH